MGDPLADATVALPRDLLSLGPITTDYGAPAAFTGLPHLGIDIGVPSGTPVPVPVGGTVTRVYSDGVGGLQAEVTTAQGFRQIFAHLSSVTAKVGDVLAPGEQVALSGRSGQVTGPHLHYEVETPANTSINPKTFLDEFRNAAPTSPATPITAQPISQPASSIGGLPLVGGIGTVFDTLAQSSTWWRLLFTLAGGGLVIIGIGLYTRALTAQHVASAATKLEGEV